jgi:hypothetical protein
MGCNATGVSRMIRQASTAFVPLATMMWALNVVHVSLSAGNQIQVNSIEILSLIYSGAS